MTMNAYQMPNRRVCVCVNTEAAKVQEEGQLCQTLSESSALTSRKTYESIKAAIADCIWELFEHGLDCKNSMMVV